jgi:putative membrane protein
MQLALMGNLTDGLRHNYTLVIITASYWVWVLLGPTQRLGTAGLAGWTVQGLILLAFALAHGVRRYGWNTMLIWGGITFFVSWSMESLSISTGFPFGNYHYTGLLGVQAGAVPLVIMPAYFVSGYLAWTMATVFLGDLGTGIEKRNLVRLPLTASLLMVIWDLCLDPVKATIDGAWIWADGGIYFGVPISNFLGWYLTVFLVFLGFGLYLYRHGTNRPYEQSKAYWVLVPVMYLGLALEFLLYPFWKTTHLEIYWSVLLVSCCTMVVVSILNILAVREL